MKKFMKLLVILISMMAICLTSCNSIESDAKKLAKMHYELTRVGDNVGSTSNVYKEKAKVLFEFETKAWEKYSKDPETKKQFKKIFDDEMKKLKEK